MKMATVSSTVKNKGPIVDPGLCRCCRSIKKCRLLTCEYDWLGAKEVYSEMFMDCFGLLLSHLDGESRECCICATCVVRLRDACAFREQVLRCEQAFLATTLENKEETEPKPDVTVKTEPGADDVQGDYSADDRDDPEYTESDLKPEIKVKRKQVKVTTAEKRTSKTRKRKVGKKELLTNMTLMRKKLNRSSDKAEELEAKPATKKMKSAPQSDFMIYSNAVTIVKSSYVCPFLNRISNYYCYYCKDQFTNPVELREHTLQHDPNTLFVSSMEHKKIPKIDITRIDCRLCDEKIEDITSLKNHLSSVHNKTIHPVTNEFLAFRLSLDKVECTECNSTFPYFDALKKHMIDHFGTFICDQCGACFLEEASLRTHLKTHNKVDANFPCEVCGKNLKSKYSRYLHVMTIHEKKPTVNCYKCDASFLSYALRNKHLIEVHGDKRTFACKLCDKVYNRRKTLMEHNRRNHMKVYRHQCDLCDQRFYIPSRLKEHMATHTGERNYRCEYCEKSYPRLQSLQEHMRSHNSERRYRCGVCDSAFTQSASLRSHVKTHHQGYDGDSFI